MKKELRLLMALFLYAYMAVASEKVTLNGEWNFKTDPYNKGLIEKWYDSNTKYDNWDKMEVPGNWDLHNEYAEYVGDAWYNRLFDVKDEWKDQAIRLVFQSVYNDCQVWVNGKEVGKNHFGFLPFEFDISEHINYGEKNQITVWVNNVFKVGAIWNWGGIRLPVWLEITDPVRLEYQHITAVPDLKKGTAALELRVVSSNKTNKDIPVTLEIKIEKKGKVIANHNIKTKIPANTKEFNSLWSIKLPKSKVELWHFDFPHLYNCSVSLLKEDEIIHSLSDRFGIRKLEVEGIKLLLNGEQIRPVGFNLVPEDRMTGNTLPMERIKEDVDMLKELGVTMCRISHLPLSKEYLDYLDEKGIMTFEEVSLWGKDKKVDPDHPMPKEWLRRMIKEKYNHPSVIGWSVGNEIGYFKDNPKVMEYVKEAIEMSKSLDPNRLAVYVSNSAADQKTDPSIYSDLIMFNSYGGWGNAAQKVWENHSKPVFMSEYGSALNNEDPNLSYINTKEMLGQMRGKEYLVGASLWTFNDYRSFYYGSEGWATPVSQNRCWGIVNTFRQKKRSYFNFKKEYAPVKELKVDAINQAKKNAQVTIIPRSVNDLPANVLRGYKLRWSVMGENFDITFNQEKMLDVIYPGDISFKILIAWGNTKSATGLKVEIIDPQGYSVLDKKIYFEVPSQPQITHVNTAQNGVRIIFKLVKGASEYVVKYQTNEKSFYSDTTINHFVTISDKLIKLKEEWAYEVIALNNAGESQPSEKIFAAKDEGELPPVIWEARRVKDNIFIGFTSSPYDYLYEVEYGNTPGKYGNSLIFKNKGVARIPITHTERPVYLRLRCRKQWGFASEWTQEVRVD